MRRIIFLACCLAPVLTLAVSGSVTKIEFNTKDSDSTGAPGIPVKLRADLCNSGGCPGKADETAHFILETSAASGEFSSSATKWDGVTPLTLTVSKGDYGRNFYYRDSVAGPVTVTVRLKENPAISATWSLTLGAGGSGSSGGSGGGSSGSTSGTGSSGSGSSSSGGSSGGSSAHEGQESLSSYQSETFAIGIGRKRLASAGSPLEFHVDQSKAASGASFLWSFGDGTAASGPSVTHSYPYAGDYIVIVNAAKDDEQAVARTTVTVIEPQMILNVPTLSQPFVELINQSVAEINLGSWRLVSGSSTFVLPRDTIVSQGGKLRLPLYYWPTPGRDWSLFRPDNVAVAVGLVGRSVSPDGGAVSVLERRLRARNLRLAQEVDLPLGEGASAQMVVDKTASTSLASNQVTSTVIELPRRAGLLGRLFDIIKL